MPLSFECWQKMVKLYQNTPYKYPNQRNDRHNNIFVSVAFIKAGRGM